MNAAERIAALLRAVAILGLLLALSGAAGWPIVRAQDDEPTETPVPALEGTLRILTAVCTVDAEPPAPVAILTDALVPTLRTLGATVGQ